MVSKPLSSDSAADILEVIPKKMSTPANFLPVAVRNLEDLQTLIAITDMYMARSTKEDVSFATDRNALEEKRAINLPEKTTTEITCGTTTRKT
jgi:hypothetical protein